MENVSVSDNRNSSKDKIQENNLIMETALSGRTGFSSAFSKLIAEGGENFLQYLKSLSLTEESDVLVLSSNRHYYYDEKEMQEVRSLINLKKLNEIKDIERFLHTLFHILPPNAGFIGCFSNDKTSGGKGISNFPASRLFSRFINFLDSRTDHIMDKKEVTELLETNGFQIVDMKEINGLTYFYSQNLRQRVKLSA